MDIFNDAYCTFLLSYTGVGTYSYEEKTNNNLQRLTSGSQSDRPCIDLDIADCFDMYIIIHNEWFNFEHGSVSSDSVFSALLRLHERSYFS